VRWFGIGLTEWVRARRARRLGEHLDRAILGAEEYRLCDGDVVPFPGYPRWTELLTRELPELAAPSQDGLLVRPYVAQVPTYRPKGSIDYKGRHHRC
jgi:hypothetical protein